MGALQQRCQRGKAAVWLVFALLVLHSAAGAALQLKPLALELHGRIYSARGAAQQRLELPLGCGKEPLALAIQHSVPPLRLQHQCETALNVLVKSPGEPGRGLQVWDTGSFDANSPPTSAEAASLWFRFQLGPSAFEPGSDYTLQLDIYCGGRAAGPTIRSAISVHAASHCPEDSQQSQTQSHLQAQGHVPRSIEWQGLTLPTASGSLQAGHGGDTTRRDRQLAEGEAVRVLLGPSSGDAVVLDGYSGLARAVDDGQMAPPCGVVDAVGQGTARCLRDPQIRTSAPTIRLAMQLMGSDDGSGSGSELSSAVQGSAFAISGDASISGAPVTVNAGTVELTLSLGQGPATVYVPEGALAPFGVNNAASNTLTIQHDTTPPVPIVTTPGGLGVTSSTQLSFSISFGEQVLATDPFDLFSFAGVRRVDAVLEIATGQLDLALYVLPEDAGKAADITVWVPRNSVSDLVGNKNDVGASLTVKYRPESSGLQGAAVAANMLLGTSLALCTSASFLASHLLPFSSAILGCGALSFVGWAQTFYLTGGLAAKWMPESYRQVANTFAWTLGDLSVPWTNTIPDMDPGMAFPFVPVALTSMGQEVDVAQYPTVTPAQLDSGEPLVALTGELSPLDGQGQALSTVLDGIPFLNPIQAQSIGAPPANPSQAPPSSSDPPTSDPTPAPEFETQEDQDQVEGDSTADQPPPPPQEDVSLPPLVNGGPTVSAQTLTAAPPAGNPSGGAAGAAVPQEERSVGIPPAPSAPNAPTQPPPSQTPDSAPPPTTAGGVVGEGSSVGAPPPTASVDEDDGGADDGNEGSQPPESATPPAAGPRPAPTIIQPTAIPPPLPQPSPPPPPQPNDSGSSFPLPKPLPPAPVIVPPPPPPSPLPSFPSPTFGLAPLPTAAPSFIPSPPPAPEAAASAESPAESSPSPQPAPSPEMASPTPPPSTPEEQPSLSPAFSFSPSRSPELLPSPSPSLSSPEPESPAPSPSPLPAGDLSTFPTAAASPSPTSAAAADPPAELPGGVDDPFLDVPPVAEPTADNGDGQEAEEGEEEVEEVGIEGQPPPQPEAIEHPPPAPPAEEGEEVVPEGTPPPAAGTEGEGTDEDAEVPEGEVGQPPQEGILPEDGTGMEESTEGDVGSQGDVPPPEDESSQDEADEEDNADGDDDPAAASLGVDVDEETGGVSVDAGGATEDGGLRRLQSQRRTQPLIPVESTSQRRRRLQAEARRGRRALLQATASDGAAAAAAAAAAQQPAFEGTVYIVASRGLQLTTPNGVHDAADVLVGGGAVQRAYDVIDAAGDDGMYPRGYYYDRLARTAFWLAVAAFGVMVAHLAVLGWVMWKRAKVPNVVWFPRVELIVCLACLPGLMFGDAGMFNGSAGDIALGVSLLILLPGTFLAGSFYLLWHWLQQSALNQRRAIFVLRKDPLADQIAAQTPATTTPTATPRDRLPGLTPRDGGDSAAGSTQGGGSDHGGKGAAGAVKGGAAPDASPDSPGGSSSAGGSNSAPAGGSPAAPSAGARARAGLTTGLDAATAAALQAANMRRWSFTGLLRCLCGARSWKGDWCSINLDSRFTFKYGPLFEATYGQKMARRRATYEFDPLRGKIDRGALVPLPELATLSWRGRALLEPHHLRTPAQLLGVVKTVVLAGAVAGVALGDSYIQCCLLILMYGFYAIYLLAVRPFNVAVVGGFELATTLCAIGAAGLAMLVMDGRGESDVTRSLVGTVMLILQLLAFLCFIAGTWWVSLSAIWEATGMRRRLRLKPSPSDRFVEAVMQVMARDPHILARKYADRWMVRSLGVGLYDRPVWRRETEDLRRLLRAMTLPRRRVAGMGSVVRRKAAPMIYYPQEEQPPTTELPPVEVAGSGSVTGTGSDAGGTATPVFTPGNTPGGPSYPAGTPAFNSLVSQDSGAAAAAAAEAGPSGSGDAVIAVPSGRRSPPREFAAQPGTELHRVLSEPAAQLAAAAAQLQQEELDQQQQQQQHL